MKLDLPRFNPLQRIPLTGALWNKLLDEVRKRTPLAGRGLKEGDRPDGRVLGVVAENYRRRD